MFQRAFVFGLLLLLSVGARAFGDPCPSVQFTQKQTVGPYPFQVQNLETVDYDHDGKLDLVGVIYQQTGQYVFGVLHSWRGVGDGTFENAVSLGEAYVWDIQVANVNNDLYDDLVGTSYNYRIWVRLGNATGFDPAISMNTDYSPYDLQVGNFNEGDSNLDLVVTSLPSGKLVVFQGNGNGTFTETRRVDIGSSDWATDNAVADYDNDGRFDVAISRRMSETVEVHFRNPNGTFAAPLILPAGRWPQQMASADFNEDGLPDLATANWEDGTVEVFLNQGGRAFAPRQIINTQFPHGNHGEDDAIRLVDINGDSHIDILAGAVNGSWLTTHLGYGNGTFAGPTWFVTDHVFSIAAGNFDSDNDLEVAVGTHNSLVVTDFTCATQVVLYSVSPVTTSGYTAKFRATVSGISAGTPLPRGTVTFKDGATTLATVNVDANGRAALDSNGLSLGDHTITAEFSGNSVLGSGVSPGIVQKVTTETTTITLNLGASTHGEPFNSTVTITAPGGWTIIGSYLLTVDGVTESQPRWSSSPLTLTLSAGTHTISAEFLGNTFYPASTSPSYLFNTAKHAVTIAKSGDTTLREGSSHTIQIAVGASTSPAPSGTVTLFRGATQIGSTALSNGSASFTFMQQRGSYDYTAVYSGDANYLTASTTFTLDTLVNAPLWIDARALDSSVYVPAVVPQGATNVTLYRRLSVNGAWAAVSGWSLNSPFDNGTGMVRGVLYDYRLNATVSNQLQQSNIDAALLFTDPVLTAGVTTVQAAHLTELRDTANALRATGLLPGFYFDGTFGPGQNIRASHIAALRTAINDARGVLNMAPVTFTDPSLEGVPIKRIHINELRAAAK